MKITTMLVTLFALAFAGSAQAATKAEIWELLQKIDGELRYYDQSPRTLDQVKSELQNTLQVLRGGNNASPQACTDFAFAEYKRDGFSNSTSLEKARDFCRSATEFRLRMDVITFLYTNLKQDGYSASTAFDYTLEIGRDIAPNGLACVRSAFDRYLADGYSKRTALEKSAEFCAK